MNEDEKINIEEEYGIKVTTRGRKFIATSEKYGVVAKDHNHDKTVTKCLRKISDIKEKGEI